MQIRGVAQIEQVVDDELIIGLDDDAVALGGVQLRHVVEHREVRDFAGIGWRRAHPDPDRLVLLDHRIALHARARRNVFGAVRVAYAGAAAVEFETVIRALDAVAADDLTHGERREAMGATILDGRDAAVTFAIEHDRLVHERAGDELPVTKLIGPRCHVPGIAQECPGNHLLPRLRAIRFRVRLIQHGAYPSQILFANMASFADMITWTGAA